MAAKHRTRLPQLDTPALTDGGLETTLIFHRWIELPDVASFVLLGNGNVPSALMTAEEAQRYHAPQTETFAATELDAGEPAELAAWHRPVFAALERLGGCCGTDDRRVAALATAWLSGGK